MRTIFTSLLLAWLFISISAFGVVATHADHTGTPANAMSLDMEEEANPSNTNSAVGTRELCRRINENNVLDADEDVVDGLLIDLTVTGIPPYHDSGTPLDYSDDTGGIIAFDWDLRYSSVNLTVQAEQTALPGVNILQRNAGSNAGSLSDPTPDDNNDDFWFGVGLDNTQPPGEDGDGVLHRLTLVTDAGAATGIYPLTVLNSKYLDSYGNAYQGHREDSAFVAVNAPCDIDGDGVEDANDGCPELAGPPSNNGCPPPGPPAVGGTAGLFAYDESDAGSSPAPYAAILTAATLAVVAGLGWRFRRRPTARHQ